MINRPRVLFLVGPTGSGKSELAISLAKSIRGEIVSADSMLVYRGMNIGTAKLTEAEQKGIRHHVVDVINPRQRFSVNRYRTLAMDAIRKIASRKRTPIVVGGSGLYIQSLIDGLASQPKKMLKIRKKLEREAEAKGIPFLYERLQKIDPNRADEILPGDQRRIVRALEIYETLHVKPSEWRERRTSLTEEGFSWVMFGLLRDRKELYSKIDARVDQMMKRGFLREVKRLLKKGLSQTARQAIGYFELTQFLKSKTALEDAIEIIKKRSRHLAKKQLIWFRREKRIHWISVLGKSHLYEGKKMILTAWKERQCTKK